MICFVKRLGLLLGLLLFLGTPASGVSAFAQSPGRPLRESLRDFQIGDEWGQFAVEESQFASAGRVFENLARATARYRGATSFYLGMYAGQALMATNYHVQSSFDCKDGENGGPAWVEFPFLGLRAPCKKVYGIWREADVALFSIAVTPEQEERLAPFAHPLSEARSVRFDEPLLTMGFGSAGNPERRMTANWDSDCRVLSGDDEFVFLRDPDHPSPQSYSAWSFATGCDASYGDSGSAVVDRSTGEVLGLLWTGALPKRREVQDSHKVREWQDRRGLEVWREFNYVVAVPKIRDAVRISLRQDFFAPEERAVLRGIIGD